MKKEVDELEDELRPEYDFSKVVSQLEILLEREVESKHCRLDNSIMLLPGQS